MPPGTRTRSSLRAVWALGLTAACGNGWSGAPPGISTGPVASSPPRAADAGADSGAPSRDASPEGGAADASREDARATALSRFPAGTLSLRVREQAHVLAAPAEGSAYIGKITRGTRVAFRRVVPADPPPPSRRRARQPCAEFAEI
ncbi:MAG: hypothetical protein FJ104_16200, partial [Deltaproteobacteria bacterium]|nr:hypothetical protein [Deltaproteobacteria bacterium]